MISPRALYLAALAACLSLAAVGGVWAVVIALAIARLR